MKDFYVNLEPHEVICKINSILENTVSGEKIDEYISGVGEHAVAVTVYEQYFYRVSNRITLTSIVDRVDGKTHVRLVSAGGGSGVVFRFDWGASESMEESVIDALRANIIN